MFDSIIGQNTHTHTHSPTQCEVNLPPQLQGVSAVRRVTAEGAILRYLLGLCAAKLKRCIGLPFIIIVTERCIHHVVLQGYLHHSFLPNFTRTCLL